MQVSYINFRLMMRLHLLCVLFSLWMYSTSATGSNATPGGDGESTPTGTPPPSVADKPRDTSACPAPDHPFGPDDMPAIMDKFEAHVECKITQVF